MSVTVTAALATVTAIIIRRRSMGRNLAFADIKILSSSSSNGNCDLGSSCVISNNGAPTPAHTSAKNNDNHNDHSSILQIVFRRHSPSWDTNLDETFPTKNSELPYGAKVYLELALKSSANPNPEVLVHGTDKDGGRGEGGGGSGAAKNNTNGPRYEVRRWSILEDPRREAIRDARQQPTTTVSQSTHSLEEEKEEEEAGTDTGTETGGISCTKYFSSRMNQYLKYNQNHARPSDKNFQGRNVKKSHVSVKVNVNHGIGEGESNEQSMKTIEIARKKSQDTPTSAHGDKKDKALRAKIFASFLIDKFGPSMFQDRQVQADVNHTPSRNVGSSSLPAPARVLDVAGGKGQLSIELAIQSKCLVQCTIIDSLIRGKGNEATLKRRDVKRIQKAHQQRQLCDMAAMTTTTTATVKEKEEDWNRGQQRHSSPQCIPTLTPALLPVYKSKCFTLKDEECLRMVRQSSFLVGLHPDEPTEDILDAAIQNNIPAAIVPCCVFAYLRPERRLKQNRQNIEINGNIRVMNEDHSREVRTYDDFIQYLMEKDPRIEKATLPFEGKNTVLTFDPR